MRQLLSLLVTVLVVNMAEAQIHINLNFNIERQPLWGPTGYDRVEYYYLPDIEVYYGVSEQRFYWFEGGVWISRSSLPSRYRGYDLYHSYKVVINEPSPYRRHELFRERYSSFKGRHGQEFIRDSRDVKYYVNDRHPRHSVWVKQQPRGKGKDRDDKPGRRE